MHMTKFLKAKKSYCIFTQQRKLNIYIYIMSGITNLYVNRIPDIIKNVVLL